MRGHGAGIQLADFHQCRNDLFGGLQGGVDMTKHIHFTGKTFTVTFHQLLA